MNADHPSTLRTTIATLDRLSIAHILFGASAQNIWGEPRFTRDIDLVVFPDDTRLAELLGALATAGFAVEPAGDLRRFESGRMVKLFFNTIPVDFVLGETDFDRSALTRRRAVSYIGVDVHAATPEDVILYKLIPSRTQDLADIEKIVRRQASSLDRSYLEHWARWLADEAGLAHVPDNLGRLLGPEQ